MTDKKLPVDVLLGKMLAWRSLRDQIDRLTQDAESLKKEIEAQENPCAVEGAEVIYTSKSNYDWEKIALSFKPTKVKIREYTNVDWSGLAKEIAPKASDLVTAKIKFTESSSDFYQLRIIKIKPITPQEPQN